MSALQRALKIRPGETRLVLSMTALSFVGMAGLAIGQSGANALFFDRIGTDALPLMYLAQGATAFVFMMGLAALLGRVDRRRAYLAIPAGLGAVVLAERVALLTDGRWIFPVLWLTVALAVLLQNVFVWGIAGVVTDTRRAKRLFPLFAAGEILGSVLGGLLTNPLVRLIGTENLLLVWAAALATSWVLCRVVLSAAGTRAQPRVRKARRADRDALAGSGGRVRLRTALATARVDDARRGAVLGPVLLALPAVGDRRHRTVPRRGRPGGVLRAVLGRDDRRRVPRVGARDQPALRAVRHRDDDARAPPALRRVVRHPAR